MAMDEIMMAVNSDVSVPLNERMTWFNGMIPRRNILKQVSIEKTAATDNSGGNPYSFEETLVEVSGSGCIQQIKAVTVGNTQNKDNGGTCYAKSQLDIIIDGKSVTFGVSSNTRLEKIISTLDINLHTGNDFIEYEPGVNNGIILDDNMSRTIKMVDPVLMFEHSLKIIGRISIEPVYYMIGSASLLASYRLFE